MHAILLIDFGSTYTKVCCVDADGGKLLGTAESYTTVETDVSDGLELALRKLREKTGDLPIRERYACSSAAGGLRMVASGLVPSLTAEAARRAALGAGAKVVGNFSYQLTEEDVQRIDALKPDILLLTGGTDGGNRDCVEHNARALARCKKDFPVVLAGNRESASVCAEALRAAGREVISVENVMPSFNKLNIEPAQKAIRELFLRRIVAAKGLSRTESVLSGILMPTPAAVLRALTLLSESLGELMAVDLGGATTDVYSIAKGDPTRPGTVLRGLPEPYAKRTVEGDIGMRYSAAGVLEAAGMASLAERSGQGKEAIGRWLARVHETPGLLAETEAEKAVDFALGSLAIEMGLLRHAGSVEQVFTPMGALYQQTGKDLTGIGRLLLTGGQLIFAERAFEMAQRAMASLREPQSLMPRKAKILIDRHYILSAMGLLSQEHADLARDMMIKEFGEAWN